MSNRPEPQTSAPDRSMVWVAAGLGIFGLANFAFLGLAGRDLGPAQSAAVSVAWTVLNAVGIGLFQPLEQETSRRLAAARALGLDGAHLGSMVRYALAAAFAIVALGLVGLPFLGDSLFSGARELVVVVVLGLLGQALAYFARGVLAGTDRFRNYGAQLAVDGGLRIVVAATLFVTGAGNRLTYGLVLVIAPVVATFVTIRVGDLVRVWRHRGGDTVSTSMAPLAANSTASQLLANLGPIAMALLATSSQQALSGSFVAAITVARIPLFLFAAIQAVFLPALAALVAQDSVQEFRGTVRRALVATGALGIVGVAGVALLGQWVLGLIYGSEFVIGTSTLTLIAVSGALFMLAQVFAQALLAHRRETSSAIGWTVGIAVSALTLAGPWELATRVSLSLCTGAAASLLVLGLVLAGTLRTWEAAAAAPGDDVRSRPAPPDEGDR